MADSDSTSTTDGDPPFQSYFHYRFGDPFPQAQDSTLQQFVRGFETLYTQYGNELNSIRTAHRVTEADGMDLNRIGALFGPLGRRRGRGDDEYRRYLMSLTRTFRGRGTARGISFAVSAVAGTSGEDDVTVHDYPDSLEYGLTIRNWAAHSGADLRYLANLADPSVVTLQEPIEYEYPSVELELTGRDSHTTLISTPADLQLSPQDSTTEEISRGFGADEFDGDGEFDGEN